MSEQPVENPRPGRVLSIIGIVLGVVALVGPLFFLGIVGAIVGFVGYRKGDRTVGLVAVAIAIVLTVVSVVLNGIFFLQTDPS